MITSNQNSKIKLVRSLMGRAKERREAGMFVVEGVRLVEEAVKGDWRLETVLYDGSLSERGKSQVESLKSKGVEVEEISTDLMKSLSETETPQGILAILQFSQLPITNYLNFILTPDQIRDPGNLGTLLRSAAATGVQAVLIPPETTDAFAPKVLRAGMGAHFRVPIREMGWEEISEVCRLSSLQVLVADMDGKSCWESDLRQPLALIVGGEAEGASEQARKLANEQISIPMAGNVESLNAGVAGSVLMFEVVRQRK
ncbi:MAG TPA: RNA methyltransferase [Anaerolineales bacterium]|nr:RNA methyltransferase [Anaerolineales bacterium]HQX15473.1 RNA methyltransferase [Anaerolineales bacterium]